MAVRFLKGIGHPTASNCRNSSGVSAIFSDSSAIDAAQGSSPSHTKAAASSTSTAKAQSSPTHTGAASLPAVDMVAGGVLIGLLGYMLGL